MLKRSPLPKRTPLQRTRPLVRTEGPAKATIRLPRCKACREPFVRVSSWQSYCRAEACAVAAAEAALEKPVISRRRKSQSERKTEKAKALTNSGRAKQAPTVAEKAWMDSITAIGCIACLIDGHPGTPGAVHHILQGGRRMGHMFTICLCDPGHHQNGRHLGKLSRHPWKARFEAKYGTEQELLSLTEQLVAQARGSA